MSPGEKPISTFKMALLKNGKKRKRSKTLLLARYQFLANIKSEGKQASTKSRLWRTEKQIV